MIRAVADADAVVGTHSPVRRDGEIIYGKPVIYSLGNFVFDGFSDANKNTGPIVWMSVTGTGILDWHLQPVPIDPSGSPHVDRLTVDAGTGGQLAMSVGTRTAVIPTKGSP